jgi:tetratricopeptide (TPR) repeat protein
VTVASGIYVPRREEEAEIRQQVEKVRADGRSRAVLLHGPGGAGKTMLVRHLADRMPLGTSDLVWVDPIDVDDSEYWLLSNLETAVAEALGREHFTQYFEHLGRIARFAHEYVSYETVLAQLSRINRTFVDCYRTYVQTSKITVVLTLDTIEAIRSMYLLLTLTQWMKELPHTLFILSGRPPGEHEPGDPLREELDDPHRPLENIEVALRGFADDEARRFIKASGLHESLTDHERDRLVDLTSRQPLWLALAVEYLQGADPPTEMTADTAPTATTRESFRRKLVTLYRSTDFWPEAIKRLAVVRHSVTQQVWSELMADRGLPPDATDWAHAWDLLLRRPWVRARANKRYVTLHDALAEELAQRVIPLHDQDGAWRNELWHRAKNIYARLTAEKDERVVAGLTRVGNALESSGDGGEGLVAEISSVDAQKRELDQLLTAQLHYAILDDFSSGTDRFLELFQRAADRRDPLFMELICHEMEMFLPRAGSGELPDEVLDLAVEQYRRWLRTEAPERYGAIAVQIAGFLVRNEQPQSALQLLQSLPDEAAADGELRYRLAIERGNASMRIPGQVDLARRYFLDALEEAQSLGASEQRALREAEAHKELGFYYRNLGSWVDADAAYRTARDVLARVMGPGSPNKFREEMASIQTNWAYLKALRGAFREARNLVDSAIAVRRRFSSRNLVGYSLSVSGEVYRYEANFARAWAAYQDAEAIFQETKSWPWLGMLYQEMAICLHQAEREGLKLVDDQQPALARALIERSLDICRDFNARAYPSALNRAGRIFAAAGEVDAGLQHLDEGIAEAGRLGDGWFSSANNIEYVEHAYRAWTDTGEARYRTLVDERRSRVAEVVGAYRFRDIAARWELLQGHLFTTDALRTEDTSDLDNAIAHYSRGFQILSDESVGSHGSAAIAREFERFRTLFDQLPRQTQRSWYTRLSEDWNAEDSPEQSTSLLARLEELY